MISRITLEPTEQYYDTHAGPVRLWRGHDGAGKPVAAWISAVMYGDGPPGADTDPTNIANIVRRVVGG